MRKLIKITHPTLLGFIDSKKGECQEYSHCKIVFCGTKKRGCSAKMFIPQHSRIRLCDDCRDLGHTEGRGDFYDPINFPITKKDDPVWFESMEREELRT